MTRNGFTLLMFALLGVMMAFASVPSANAQSFSGRGVDMRAIQGESHSCRDPAMNLQGRLIRLRIAIKQILKCNAKGGFYRENGKCELAVSPGHIFVKDPGPPTLPRNEDTLTFITGGGTALIGGPDGEGVQCCQDTTGTDISPCPTGQTGSVYDPYSVNCATGDRTYQEPFDTCEDIEDLPCAEDPTHPDYPDCGGGGDEGSWICDEWSSCSESCDGGEKTCQSVACEGGTCEGAEPSADSFGTLPCNEEACGTWVCGTWSSCSESCGEGTQSCTSVQCNSDFCDGTAPPVSDFGTPSCTNGPCGAWECDEWSACTADCDGGTQSCERVSCVPDGAATCGELPAAQSCNTHACDACVWELEADWSACSESCGGGTQTKGYVCSCGAGNCSGNQPEAESRGCSEQACPGTPTCPSPRPNDCPLVGTSAVAPSCCLTDSGAEWRCPLSSGDDPCNETNSNLCPEGHDFCTKDDHCHGDGALGLPFCVGGCCSATP